jgi:3-oxoacyl-[acyl-carrier protein] reductase
MNSHEPLAGRVAVVTGASRRARIGYALARRLGMLGADLYLQGWRAHDAGWPWGEERDDAKTLTGDLKRETGSRVEYLEANFEDPNAPDIVIRGAVDAYGHADILVANHARASESDIDTLTVEGKDAQLAVDVRATVLLMQAFALRHTGRPGGRVVLFTSTQHMEPHPGNLAYAVSKGAIHQMTLSFAQSLIHRGIVLNTVNPGPTDNSGYPQEMIDDTGSFPQGRWGQPEDVARLVGWLCTDDAQWVVGQVINSEGGSRM